MKKLETTELKTISGGCCTSSGCGDDDYGNRGGRGGRGGCGQSSRNSKCS